MHHGRLLVFGLLLLALFAAGCGSENPHMIPQERASSLTAAVDDIRAACDDNDAAKARAAVDAANQQVSELPREVSTGLKRNLRDWISHIEDRIGRDCEKAETPTATPTETPTETPTPTATPTQTPDEGGVPAPEDDG
jgi:hypothetical protein